MTFQRNQYTILVVDDYEASRYASARTLKASGFQTMETASGSDALELAEYASAVLLDVNLPDIGGIEVAQFIRAHPRTAHLPIVHLTATRQSLTERAAGLQAGAQEYLFAPFDPKELVAIFDRLLGQGGVGYAPSQSLNWAAAFQQLQREERRLLQIVSQLSKGGATQAELDAAFTNVHQLRQRAEDLLVDARESARGPKPD